MTELRAAVAADIPLVLGFWAGAATDEHRPVDTAAALERLIDRDPLALTIAVSDGAIVGSLIAGWDGWRYHLYRLAVDPHRRREGIARALLEQAEQRLAALGAIRIDAMVLGHNPDAHRFWSAAGYEPQTEWNRWIKLVSAALEDEQ